MYTIVNLNIVSCPIKRPYQMLQLVQRSCARDIRSNFIGAQVLLLQMAQHRVRLLLDILDVIVCHLDVPHLLRTKIADQFAPITTHEGNGVVLVEQPNDMLGGHVINGLLVSE